MGTAPSFYLVLGCTVAAVILCAMFLNAVRAESPDKFEELTGRGSMLDAPVGPFVLAFNCVFTLEYESWDLSSTAIWLGRSLFAVLIAYLGLILWALVALLRL